MPGVTGANIVAACGGHGNPLLLGESHGQRSLVGYSPWGHTESDTTEATKQQQQSEKSVEPNVSHLFGSPGFSVKVSA